MNVGVVPSGVIGGGRDGNDRRSHGHGDLVHGLGDENRRVILIFVGDAGRKILGQLGHGLADFPSRGQLVLEPGWR